MGTNQLILIKYLFKKVTNLGVAVWVIDSVPAVGFVIGLVT